jgi:hypothetical protein
MRSFGLARHRISSILLNMPELSRFLGLLIKIQFQDHTPPHIHVWYGKRDRATIAIEDGSVLAGNLPRPQLMCIGAWVYMHQNELMDAWERASHHLAPRKISPLRS